MGYIGSTDGNEGTEGKFKGYDLWISPACLLNHRIYPKPPSVPSVTSVQVGLGVHEWDLGASGLRWSQL